MRCKTSAPPFGVIGAFPEGTVVPSESVGRTDRHQRSKGASARRRRALWPAARSSMSRSGAAKGPCLAQLSARALRTTVTGVGVNRRCWALGAPGRCPLRRVQSEGLAGRPPQQDKAHPAQLGRREGTGHASQQPGTRQCGGLPPTSSSPPGP